MRLFARAGFSVNSHTAQMKDDLSKWFYFGFDYYYIVTVEIFINAMETYHHTIAFLLLLEARAH